MPPLSVACQFTVLLSILGNEPTGNALGTCSFRKTLLRRRLAHLSTISVLAARAFALDAYLPFLLVLLPPTPPPLEAAALLLL